MSGNSTPPKEPAASAQDSQGEAAAHPRTPLIPAAPPGELPPPAGEPTGPPPSPPEAPPETRTKESPVEALNKQLQSLSDKIGEVERKFNARVTEVEKVKEKLAEFNFQTITVILGVLTLVAAIPLVLLHGGEISTGQVAGAIFALLFVDTVVAVIWIVLWARLNFSRHK